MTRTIAVLPAALALALSLSACGGPSDATGNVALSNDVLLNDEGATGNFVGDNVVLPEESLDNEALSNGSGLDGAGSNKAAPATNGL